MIDARIEWKPDSSEIVSVANNRVCLALLRIYLSVPSSVSDIDLEEAIRPLWPLIRLEAGHLRNALLADPARVRGRKLRRVQRVSQPLDEGGQPEWLARLTDTSEQLPTQPPEVEVLQLLGEGMLMDRPAFRPLFGAVRKRLERLVVKHPAPVDNSIALLADLLKLGEAERGVLSLCWAIEAGSIGSSAFAQVRKRSRQVQALQAALNLATDRDLRGLMAPDGRLARSGLLHTCYSDRSDADMEDQLRLSRQGSALLASTVQSVDDMASTVLKPLSAGRAETPLAWPHLQSRIDLLEALLTNSLKTGERGINVLLYGAPGTGKSEFAAQLVQKIGVVGFSVRDADEDSSAASRAERLASLQLSQLFAPAHQSVLVLDEAEDIFQNDYNNPLARVFGKKEESKAWMNSVLEGNAKPVLWISNHVGHIDPAYLRRFSYCLEFPTTPRRVRRTIADLYLGELGCSSDLMDSVATHPDVSPALLASAARFARLAQTSGTTSADAAVRHMLTDSLKAMGTELPSGVPRRATRFDLKYLNVKGLIQPPDILSGLERMGRGTLLLSGPPGTGKTQLAAEIARRMGRELVYKTAADINTMWFGESERNVAKMFTECDPESEVLFLDEADTLLASREAGGHRADVAVAAEFLRRVEAFDGVFICATNYRSRLDAALMRRFSFRLEFLSLSVSQKQQLLFETATGWSDACGLPQPQLKPLQAARLERLDKLTPGDFANVVKRMRALGLTLTLGEWIDELASEHETKPDQARASMGFL